MSERPEYDPYTSKETRQGAMTRHLLVVITILASGVCALLWRRYVGP